MTLYHSMTRARALLFTLLLIGGLWALPGPVAAEGAVVEVVAR